MVTPELRVLASPYLARPALPPDPRNCAVWLQAEIGAKGTEGADVFDLTVCTPDAVRQLGLPRWGVATLILSQFSWEEVERSIGRLLAQSARDTWEEVVIALRPFLHWEFENYHAGSNV